MVFALKSNLTGTMALSCHKAEIFFHSDLQQFWKAQTRNVILFIEASDQDTHTVCAVSGDGRTYSILLFSMQDLLGNVESSESLFCDPEIKNVKLAWIYSHNSSALLSAFLTTECIWPACSVDVLPY